MYQKEPYIMTRHIPTIQNGTLHEFAEATVSIENIAIESVACDLVPNPHVSHSPQMTSITEPDSVSQRILPQPLTSLVGRERETAEVVALLQRPEVHLVSIVGTAGVGKTRLALQVATDLMESFVDGVFFVTLASLCNAELVL